jgi:amidase
LGAWELPFEDGIIELCRGALRAFQNAQPELITVQDIDEVLFDEQDFWSSWTTIRSAIVSHGAIGAYGEEALLGRSSRVREELQWEVQRGLEITPDDLENAHDLAKEFSSVMEVALSERDALALPSAQVWPFPISCKWPRKIASVDVDTYHRWMQVAIPASLAGLPVVTVPAGFSEEGLPMGIQLIGRKGGDELLLQLARLYQNTLSFCVEPYTNFL